MGLGCFQRELLKQISEDHTKIVQGWLGGQELF